MSNRYFALIGFAFLIIIALPVAVYLVQRPADIRPRAITGQANLLLSTDNTNPSAGQTFTVLVSTQLTDDSLRVSGADFSVLYDKNLLTVTDVKPAVQSTDPAAAFTDAPIVNPSQPVDETYDAVHIAETTCSGSGAQVTCLPNAELKGGSVTLGRITFRATAQGTGVIKFPDSIDSIQIVGINI